MNKKHPNWSGNRSQTDSILNKGTYRNTLKDVQLPNYRFSGHESFACRYAWLPKAVQAVVEDPSILSSTREDDAMVELGVGKNMVRSARFWAECAGFIEQSSDGYHPSGLGTLILLGSSIDDDGENFVRGLDPYLEDIQTLWLLHWRLGTYQPSLIFVWDYLLNRYQRPELNASAVIEECSKSQECRGTSPGSLEQLWNVFLHSYIPTRGRKGDVREDNLDCPLVELEFLIPTTPTVSAINPGKTEQRYAFRREEKPEIGPGLFAFCLWEFWQNHHAGEQTIPLHLIANGHGSPGQIFKIPEQDIRNRLFGIEEKTQGFFRFEESATIPRLVLDSTRPDPSINDIYNYQTTYA